jgi:hypothetical protein
MTTAASLSGKHTTTEDEALGLIHQSKIQSTSKGQRCTWLIIPKAGKTEMLYHDKQVMFKAPYCRHIPVGATSISIAYNFVSPFYLNSNMGSGKNIQNSSAKC